MNINEAIEEVSRLITEWGMSFYVSPPLAAVIQANGYLFKIDLICDEFPSLRQPVQDIMQIYTLTH